jgi:Spy/CpxP family protein refolding chaperone
MHRLGICLFSMLFAVVPLVAAAQAPESHEHMGMGRQMRTEHSLNMLQERLNLSESQTSQVKDLIESRQSRFDSIREETRPKFRQLMSLLNKPNPDPYAVGEATIALKQVHEKATMERARMEKDFMNILNEKQRQAVNDAKAEAPTVMALHGLGLITPEHMAEQHTELFGR